MCLQEVAGSQALEEKIVEDYENQSKRSGW